MKFKSSSFIASALLSLSVSLSLSATSLNDQLCHAAKTGNAPELQRILALPRPPVGFFRRICGQNGLNFVYLTANGNPLTALMFAAAYGHTECVKMLINANADVNAADKYGDTALIYATRENNFYESCLIKLSFFVINFYFRAIYGFLIKFCI